MREVSINIPFFNRLDLLSRCIRSIEENTPRDLYELVLINDGSTEEQVVEYAKSKADVFVNHSELMGIARSRYDGVEISNCKYICTLDDDVILPPKWLETLLNTFKMDHLHPPQLSLPRCIQIGVDVKILAAMQYGRVSQCIFGNQPFTPNYLLIVTEVGTFCMLFEKSLVDQIGNFDTHLFNVWSDLDFCRRISQNVFDLPNNPVVAIDTRVIVYHHGWYNPITGVMVHLDRKANTRALISQKSLRAVMASKFLHDRWNFQPLIGIWDGTKDTEYLNILRENGIDTTKPMCESWAHFPIYKFLR